MGARRRFLAIGAGILTVAQLTIGMTGALHARAAFDIRPADALQAAQRLSVSHRPRVIALRMRVYRYAVHHQKGCPYVWGGNGPCSSGYDCSGLVVAAYRHLGVTLPRTTEAMAGSPKLRRIPARDARKGDLAMWFSGGAAVHVELVSYKDRWVFGETDGGHVSGFTQDWGSPVFYAVRR